MMDWKAFIASMTGSLAWPTVVLTGVIVFRPQLRSLVGRFKKIGAGSLQFELAEQIEEARDQAELEKSEQPSLANESAELDPATLELVRISPAMAVLHSFKQLEGLILEIRKLLPDNRPHRTLNEVLQYLQRQNLISASVGSLFQQLRQARNSLAHSDEESITRDEALDLIGQSQLLRDILTRVRDQFGKRE